MINELKELSCMYCHKKGLRKREAVIKDLYLTQGNEIEERTYWYVFCEYCKRLNKVLWNLT